MMGRRAAPEQLIYDFRLDHHVPAHHVLRQIGCPPTDPELMIHILIISDCYEIHSKKRLCEHAHLNPAFRWYCRLDLSGKAPDQSTFSKNRHSRLRKSDLFRCVFETVIQRCIEEGLVGGEGCAVDAGLIQADANKQRSAPSLECDPANIPQDVRQPAKDYLAKLADAAFGRASEVTPGP
jgi:transposase